MCLGSLGALLKYKQLLLGQSWQAGVNPSCCIHSRQLLARGAWPHVSRQLVLLQMQQNPSGQQLRLLPSVAQYMAARGGVWLLVNMALVLAARDVMPRLKYAP